MSGFLKFADERYSLDSEGLAEVFVGDLFTEIANRYGEEKARKMFAPYGRALNNKDATRTKNAGLILELCHMDKPNISELARKLAVEDKNNATRFEAWRQQISEARRDKEAIAEARKIWEYCYESKFDDHFCSPKQRRKRPVR
ncbi:MAG: hypothetical protein WB689_37685 [Xanthobacteraceae bacterium]